MKKLLIILFLLIGSNVYSQTFTQTFVDRCTGEVKVVTANFINGSATVAFYSRIRTFTYAEFTSGVLNQWLIETYEWWSTLSPCSTATQQAQQAQQTAQNASQAASTASAAASTAASASSSVPTGGATNATNQTTNGGSTTEGTNTNSSSSTESTKSKGGGGSSETKSEGGGETSEGGGESKSEGGETESKSEESSEESSDKEGGDKEESGDDDGDGKKSKEKEKKRRELMPVQLRADMMGNQNLMGGYDAVVSIGATQSSIFGDETYGATAMIYSNLKQVALNASYTKVHMEKLNLSTLYHEGHTHYSKTAKVDTTDPIVAPTPKLKSITSASLGYMNNFGNGTIVVSVMEIKPMGKWGTAGVGVNMVNMFGEGKYQSTMLGYNILYTNMINLSQRIQYAPAFIWTQSPYMGRIGFTKNQYGKDTGFAPNQLRGTQIDGMMILSNSFTIQLTRRFSFNAGVTFIKSTNPLIPLIKSFAIGTKLPF